MFKNKYSPLEFFSIIFGKKSKFENIPTVPAQNSPTECADLLHQICNCVS